MTKLKPTALLLLAISCGSLNAQTAIAATGEDASGSGGSVSYTIGQVVYTTATGTTGSVAQGVQQPYDVSITTGVELENISLEMVAFPNPTKGNLLLSIANFEKEQLSYQLIDVQGKLVSSGKATSINAINMQSLPISTYFLNVQDNNSIIKTFRIIKK